MIPWLGLEDQHFVLPDGHRYERKEDQEAFIRGWLRGAGMTSEADDLRIAWYDARYHQVRVHDTMHPWKKSRVAHEAHGCGIVVCSPQAER